MCGYTHVDDALFVHALGRVVEVGEHDGHLVVCRHQLLFARLHLLLQLCPRIPGELRARHALLDALTRRVQAMHRLAQVLVAELDVHCAGRL